VTGDGQRSVGRPKCRDRGGTDELWEAAAERPLGSTVLVMPITPDRREMPDDHCCAKCSVTRVALGLLKTLSGCDRAWTN
jgi:hypothetical protein